MNSEIDKQMNTVLTPAAADALDWRVLTELDDARLRRLRRQYEVSDVVDEALDVLLNQADLVSSREVPAQVVTMNSRVRVSAPQSGKAHLVTICYPAEADVERGRVSVLSPMGIALLGHREGQVVPWMRPDGSGDAWLIETVEYQPEAAGDFHL